MKKTIYITIFLSILYNTSFTQKLEVKADTATIRIGEPVHLNITAFVRAQDTVRWFSFKGDTLTKDIQIIEQSSIDTSYDEEDITVKILTQNLTVTAFDSGYFVVPPFKIYLNQKDSLLSEPLLIEVQTVEIDTSQAIKDIAPPLEVKFSLKEWLSENWPFIAGGLALLAVISYLIYYFFFRKKPVEEPKEEPVIIPPHELALQKLDEVEKEALWKSGKEKEYHSKISEILREYIENRFNVNALEQTTSEIIRNLRYTNVHQKDKDNLYKVLFLADMVKYAKEKPLPDENIQSLELAKQFVLNTKPEEQTAEQTIEQTPQNT